MKNIKKLLAFVAVFAMVLVAVFALAACNGHKCKHECPICHNCTSDCDDPACAEKCDGHPTAHVCHSVCLEPGCGKCTSNCSDPVCANNRCLGHAPAHTCTSVCAICGACTNSSCNETVCGSKCSGHGPFTSIWVDSATTEKLPYEAGNLVSVKLKSATVSFSLATELTADDSHAYIAVKYSGTAVFHEISVYGTKDGGAESSGVVAAVHSDTAWNVTKTVGTDFSVVVAQIGGYYGATELDIDTITNVGITLTGAADDTFTVHEIKLLPNNEHGFGTPTPPPVEGDLEVGKLVATPNAQDPTPISISEDGKTVSFSAAPGWNTVTAQVTNYTSEYKYLVLEFTASENVTISVRSAQQDYLTTPWVQEMYAAGANKRIIDLTEKELPAQFLLIFVFNANNDLNNDYSSGEAKTVAFSKISFEKNDPDASAEANHFRTPTVSGLMYSQTTGEVSYTNTAAEGWRYLEMLIDNYDTDFDVLKLRVTGYNGLVMGVRVLYNDVVAGNPVPSSKDVIASSAYYSKIETDTQTDIYIYLEADGIKGCTVTGIQLYFDGPAGAGNVGACQVTLHEIAFVKTATDVKEVTITAEPTVTITTDDAPNFNVTLKNAEGTDIEGRVLTEYRKKNEEGQFVGNYTAGLPTTVGEYEVRFYYMGSAEYKYSRTVTSVLTITEGSTPILTVIGEMVNDSNNAYTIANGEGGSQTVSYDSYRGTANTIVNVKNWDPSQKYLVIELEANGTCKVGVCTAAAAWPDISGSYIAVEANTRTTLVYDMTGKSFSETDGNLYFIYNDSIQWGTALEEGAATTITFYSISFSDTNPNEAAGE